MKVTRQLKVQTLGIPYISRSSQKSILKAIVFQFVTENIYNVALLDYDQESQTWNDMAKSNNGDLPKILSTMW
ncbi:MAG: DUF6934 family protein [Cytophagales bacterium]